MRYAQQERDVFISNQFGRQSELGKKKIHWHGPFQSELTNITPEYTNFETRYQELRKNSYFNTISKKRN